MSTTTATLTDADLYEVKINLIHRLSRMLLYKTFRATNVLLVYDDAGLTRSLMTQFTEPFYLNAIAPAILVMDATCTVQVSSDDGACWFKLRSLPHENEPARDYHIKRLPPWKEDEEAAAQEE